MEKNSAAKPQKTLPLAGELFTVDGHTAFLIRPKSTTHDAPTPWIWYAPTLPRLPGKEESWMFEQFLANGVAIAGVDVGESYGSPTGRRIFSAFYEELVAKQGMAPRPCLLARSRGGLMLYNWAVEHPEAVAGIAGIYPVCNIQSYPGLDQACGAYGMNADQLAASVSDHNPIDRLAPLAKAEVPIHHIHGGRDVIVPLAENSGELAKRYKSLGGTMTLEVVKDGGHTMWPKWFRNQSLIDFAISRATAGTPIDVLEDLDGADGKVFRVDLENKRFELLKETAFDPKTHEGRSRYTVYWTDETKFIKVLRQNSFEGLDGEYLAHFKKHKDSSKEELVTLNVAILAEGEDGVDMKQDSRHFLVPFSPDPKSNKWRRGRIEFDGEPLPVRLRGPRAKVDIRTFTSAGDLAEGFWGTTIHGERQGDRFVVESMELYPRPDPRKLDDPDLPRILVVGDSISMNYHSAAKNALQGVANYYRVEGNGGPSDRGVVCMELWLGDYTQKGLQWDVIQFNHGLHDLKQAYDEETGTYGTHQVPLEEYQANLEKEIQIMKKTGAKLVWCTTTPVPQSSHGRWPQGTFGRRKDEDLVYNQAALEVIRKYPEIEINDLNTFIRESNAFDEWRQQKDVHFWNRDLQKIVGQAVAERLKQILSE